MRWYSTGMRTKPPPKNTIPTLRKARDRAGREIIAPWAASGAANDAIVPLPGGSSSLGNGSASGFFSSWEGFIRCLPIRRPAVPAARSTHTGLIRKAPAASPISVKTNGNQPFSAVRPMVHAAERISAMTTGPRPARTPWRPGIVWNLKYKNERMITMETEGIRKATTDRIAPKNPCLR